MILSQWLFAVIFALFLALAFQESRFEAKQRLQKWCRNTDRFPIKAGTDFDLCLRVAERKCKRKEERRGSTVRRNHRGCSALDAYKGRVRMSRPVQRRTNSRVPQVRTAVGNSHIRRRGGGGASSVTRSSRARERGKSGVSGSNRRSIAAARPAAPQRDGKSKSPKHIRRAVKVSRSRLKQLKDQCGRRAERQFRQADQMQPQRRRGGGGMSNGGRGSIRRNPKARRQKTELSVNDPDDYWDGDLVLTDEQADVIEKTFSNTGRRKKRKVGRSMYKLWSRLPISYDFTYGVNERTRRKIRKAIKLWQDNTCVRFLENGPSVNRIEFSNGGGCSSYVGMVGGTQEVSIYAPGCDNIGIISHEIGHALGFHHEQARNDRDRYVHVNMHNVDRYYHSNFAKVSRYEMNDYGHPYDYGSVMHYDAYSFTANPNVPSIQTLDGNYQYTIGQRIGPSFIDFAQVNSAYCRNKCSGSLKCEHRGYPNPNNCQRCKCPEGIGGRTCDTVQYNTCGGELLAYRQEGHISSPNYPSSFPSNSHCAWFIRTQKTHNVYLQFVGSFDMDCKDVCDDSYVEVKVGEGGNDFRRTGSRFCCNRPATRLVSTNNEMVVIFKSLSRSGRGFKAKYWTDAATNRGPGPVTAKPQTRPPVTQRPYIWTTRRPSGPTGENAGGPGCRCHAWTRWSSCSQYCGGCGKISRSRHCKMSDCFGHEERKCNMEACYSDQRALIGNGEVHVLVNGCCLGLFQDEYGVCGPVGNGGLVRAVPSILRRIYNGLSWIG